MVRYYLWASPEMKQTVATVVVVVGEPTGSFRPPLYLSFMHTTSP